jgi:N-acetyl-1-D-myo-inositol-2-amino-2-deoxy-alpha-D-glucopyranoside deacetylase
MYTGGCTDSMRNRILAVVGSSLGGVFVASVATVVHAEAFPFVVAASLAVVALFVIALRLVTEDRLVATAAAIAILATVFVFSQRSAGGSVLIQGDLVGNVWVFGSAVIAGLAIAWPQIRRPERD